MSIFHWRNPLPKPTKVAILTSIGLVIFSLVYHYFGHGVSSLLMASAFTLPLIHELLRRVLPPLNEFETALLQMSNHTWIVSFLLYGVFEIYGSIQPLVYVLFTLAIVIDFILMGLVIIKKLTVHR